MTKRGATGNFFFIFAKKKGKKVQYFPTKEKIWKKKKKKLRPPDGPQFWPPSGQETDFFLWAA